MVDMMEEEIVSPEEELKRADHLIYVSLKYTRTCDIMKNAMKRLINAFEMSMYAYLEDLRKEKKIKEVPGTIKERAILVKKLVGNPVNKYMALYNLLKKIDKAEYSAKEEFRKNVTFTTKNTPTPIEVKVVNLYQYLEITKEFVSFMRAKSFKR